MTLSRDQMRREVEGIWARRPPEKRTRADAIIFVQAILSDYRSDMPSKWGDPHQVVMPWLEPLITD